MSWLELIAGQGLTPGTFSALQNIFDAATLLGVYDICPGILTWDEKLWTLAVHWELQEGPCLYDEMGDKPFILNLSMVFLRLQNETKVLRTRQEQKAALHPIGGLDPSTRPSCKKLWHNVFVCEDAPLVLAPKSMPFIGPLQYSTAPPVNVTLLSADLEIFLKREAQKAVPAPRVPSMLLPDLKICSEFLCILL